MIRNDIKHQELLDCVNRYEHEIRNATFVSEISKYIYRYKATRRDKLVIAITGSYLDNKYEGILSQAMSLVLADENLADNVDLYTTGSIPERRVEELEHPLRQQGLSVSVFDQTKMENVEHFSTLLDNTAIEQNEQEIDPSFFDYLALSNDSSDIKNGFFYSLLLMEVYRHQPVTEIAFYDICQTKYGRNQTDVKLAIKSLRKRGKLEAPQKGGIIMLTGEEQRSIEASIKEARSEEGAFKECLNQIVSRYGLKDSISFFEILKGEYLKKYNVLSNLDEISEEKERKNGERWGVWTKQLKYLDDVKAEALLGELKQLCESNEYMDQYGLIHSFLELFRSEKYKGYIDNKLQYVYLDTPVIVNYICAKSSFQDSYDLEWDNTEFNGTYDLLGYCEETKNSIRLVCPHDYLQEVLGELKKALQFSWFNQFDNLPIPVETANIFYNYYLEVKKKKELYGEDTSGFTFEAFAKQLGFPDLNTESAGFFYKNLGYLRFYLKKLGCEPLDKVEVNHTLFDDVKIDYVWYLHDKGKSKSDLAVNADVRQALHITQEVVSSGFEQEYYFVSWDNTLYHLRNKAKDVMEIAGKSYNIFKPSELAEKLAFRNFRFSKECVSNEVFAYANTNYNVKDKIRSLYDNVLNPYFASFGKSNSAFVLAVLQMQKASMEGGEGLPSRDDKTALENIFVSIISELSKNNCSTQNLKDYLNDAINNDYIIPLFTQAFDDYSKGKQVNIGKNLCDMVKAYVSKDDKEIKL